MILLIGFVLMDSRCYTRNRKIIIGSCHRCCGKHAGNHTYAQGAGQ